MGVAPEDDRGPDFRSFLLVAVLTIVLGFGAFIEVNALADLTARMYRHPLAVSNAVLETQAAVATMQRDMRDVVLASTPVEIEAAVAEIDELERRADPLFNVMADRFLGDKARIKALHQTFAAWKPIRDEIIALARVGRIGDATALSKARSTPLVDTLTGQMTGLVLFARGKAAEFQSLSEAQYRRSRLILTGLIASILLAIMLVSVFVVLKVKTTERRLLENQAMLRRAQKMEAVGQLTGGIAHDFNNILAIVMGFLGILQRRIADDPTARECVEKALKGAERGAQLTRKLLKFSRKEAGPAKRTAVNEIISDMQDLIAKSLTSGITVETQLASDTWPVMIDSGDFEDAVLNLALNAHDAMPHGGLLVIETANKTLDEHYVQRNPGSRIGDYVMVSVSDTGSGMTTEVKERLFEPFFTTKGEGKGTGLGLSMVYGFVQRSQGHVKVYSEPGHGTTIRLYLPRIDEGPSEVHAELAGEAPRGRETILIVDDEESLIEIARFYIEDLGYRTVTANDGRQALEILKRDGKAIDLLFSDVVMHGDLDGYRLALAARAVRPGLKVLLSSGFTPKREKFANGEGAFCAELAANLLSKPYNQAELAVSLRRTLDA